MKSQLENKLNKLPEDIEIDNTLFVLFISKYHINDNEVAWLIEYRDEENNPCLSIQHTSLQAAVDTTLREVKQYIDEEYRVIEFLKKHTNYKLKE